MNKEGAMFSFLDWFSTSSEGKPYMPGWHCMAGDKLWGWTTIVLCLTIIIGYCIIAYHWYTNLKTLKPGLAKTSLFNMVNIFLFCGICGYLFTPLKMWWPAWKLHNIFLIVLNIFTWRYALNTPKLRVVYEEIHDAGKLSEELQVERKRNKDIVDSLDLNIIDRIDKLQKDIHFDFDGRVSSETIEKLASVRMAILEIQKGAKEVKRINNGESASKIP